MKLPELSVKRRVTFLMLFIGIFGMGAFGLTQLGVDMYPDMEFPMIMVTSSMEGAGPEEMENLVTNVLEQAVARVSNVKAVTSESMAGLSIVIAEFNWGHSLDEAETDVRRMMEDFAPFLPEDATDPDIFAMDPSMQPVMFIGFTSENLNDFELRKLVEEELEPLFSRIDGVGSAITQGGLTRQIRVEIDPARLESAGLTVSQVVGALSAVRNDKPAGSIDAGGIKMTLRIESAFHSVEEIEQLVVGARGRSPILLRDVAEIIDGEREQLQYTRFNGEPAVVTYLNRRSDANTVNVCRRIRSTLDDIRESYRGQLTPLVLFDQSEFIEQSIGNLGTTAIQASVFAFLVLLVFLTSWRSSSVVGLAIPISVFVTFAVMNFAGLELNIISLAGLALAIGLLVDNAIVVMESIYRFRQSGKQKESAAVEGAGEVSNAITASTLTTLAVFLPILFVPGITGELFREMVLTITFSLSVSLFVALSLVPLITSWVNKLAPRHSPKSLPGRLESGFTSLEKWYNGRVSWSVSHKKLVISLAAAAFVLAIIAMRMLPSDFLPESDDGFMMLSLDRPVGTSLERTDSTVRLIEDSIRAIIPEQDRVAMFTSTGQSEGIMAIFGSNASSTALIRIRLVPVSQRETSMFEYEDRLREVIEDIPDVDYSSQAGMAMFGGAAIEIEVYGDDLDSLYAISERLKAELGKIDGAVDISSSVEDQVPEYTFAPDPVRMSLFGITSPQLSSELANGFMGATATVFWEGEDQYDVFVRYPEEYRDSREDLEYAPVMGRPLNSYGVIGQRLISSTITRKNQARMATVSCGVSGRSLGSFASDVSAMLDTVDLRGHRIELGGEMEDQKETFFYLGIAIAVAAALVYMVMAGQFESFLEPFIIIFTLPLAFIGVVLMLLLTQTPLSVMSLVGMVMLAGIVVNNGIVMVDYANQLRRRGRNVIDAIVEAATIRMRPIVMTATTTILAMTPLALEIGEGAESWSPMAITVIGGLLMAMVLTLIVEPCIYVVFGCRKRFRQESDSC